jgi:hypothetical protein
VDGVDDAEHELDLGHTEVKARLREFRQGDVLDVGKLAWLYSPDSPNHPSELTGVPAEEPVMTQEAGIEPRLAAIISQTCDLWQTPDIDQWVLLCPLTQLEEDDYADALYGRSVRFFSYPTIEEHEEHEEHEHLALDARIIVPLEKMALFSEHIRHVSEPLSEPRRSELSDFLGDRLGRYAFPDEVNELLIGPIVEGLKRVIKKAAYRTYFDAAIYFGVEWTPGKSVASLLVLTSAYKRQMSKVGADDVANIQRRLADAIAHRLKDSPYEVSIDLRDAEATQAVETLRRHEIRPDLHGTLLAD